MNVTKMLDSMSSATDIRGLKNFIVDIRACKSKEAEQARVNKELANIRKNFKGRQSHRSLISCLLLLAAILHEIGPCLCVIADRSRHWSWMFGRCEILIDSPPAALQATPRCLTGRPRSAWTATSAKSTC